MANSFALKNFTALSDLHPNMANLVGFHYYTNVQVFAHEMLCGNITLYHHYWFTGHICIIDKYIDTHWVSIIIRN